jgi:glycosyltransferase involved in cell wall biosynthesis
MKILFIAGGTPHYYNLVLNKLNQFEDIEVILVAPADGGKTVGSGVHQTQEGIEFKLYHLEEYKTYYGKMFFRGIEELIDKEQPNIIVSNWPYQLAWVFFPLLYWKIRKKHIKLISKEIPFQVPYYHDAVAYYTRGGGISENNQKGEQENSFLTKIRYKFITEIRKIFVNRVDAHINYFDEATAIQGSYGVPAEKVFITANSPDTDTIFEAKGNIENLEPILPKNPFRIIHVGRLVRWKRVDLLIEATQKLSSKYPNIELLVIGTGPDENNLKEQVEKGQLQNHVRFVGGIYDMPTLGRYFQSSSIYVLAGMGGLSINEAMCFGLPVVCSVADGTEKRLVRENQNGHYFTNGNLESLEEVIDRMLGDLPKTKQMGIESERIIREEINIHTVLGKYQEAFNFAMNSQPKSVNL